MVQSLIKFFLIMKKIIFTAAAVFAFVFANAQDIKFGVKAGVGASTLSGDVENADAKFSGHVGGFAEFKFDKFAIQPEIQFSLQGAEWELYDYWSEGDYYSSKIEANLVYLNVPIIAKYYVMDKVSVEFGPQIGILLSAKADYTYTNSGYYDYDVDSSDENIRDDLKTIDFGLNFGGAYHLNKNMAVGLRYTLGLTDINDMPYDNSKVKNQVLQASFAYNF